MAEVTANNYTDIAKGDLLNWLAKYFATGASKSVYLVAFCDKLAEADDFSEEDLTAAFNATHQVAYFKSICVTTDDSDTGEILASAAVSLCKLCEADDLLSSAPLLPNYGGTVDTLYTTVKAAGYDAFFSYKKVTPVLGELYNPALVTLGIALSVANATGTCAGNAFDFVGNKVMLASGEDDESLTVSEQNLLKAASIQYWKYVGDTSGNTAAYGAKSIKGKHMSAYWLVAYCNYMCKVRAANYMVGRDVRVSLDTYNAIISMMSGIISAFVTAGILENFVVTAPAYASRPASEADEIIIPNAWRATFLDKLRKVKVTGQLVV